MYCGRILKKSNKIRSKNLNYNVAASISKGTGISESSLQKKTEKPVSVTDSAVRRKMHEFYAMKNLNIHKKVIKISEGKLLYLKENI